MTHPSYLKVKRSILIIVHPIYTMNHTPAIQLACARYSCAYCAAPVNDVPPPPTLPGPNTDNGLESTLPPRTEAGTEPPLADLCVLARRSLDKELDPKHWRKRFGWVTAEG